MFEQYEMDFTEALECLDTDSQDTFEDVPPFCLGFEGDFIPDDVDDFYLFIYGYYDD